MVEIICTEPALNDLEAIADCIALDKPEAARRLVQTVFAPVEQLDVENVFARLPPPTQFDIADLKPV